MSRKSLKESLASKTLYDDGASGKERERRIVKGFLARLQLRCSAIINHERPDFLLRFALDDKQLDVACELTDYFSDAGSHGSPQARFVRKWKRFAKVLRHMLDEAAPGKETLATTYGAIHFLNPDYKILDQFDHKAFASEMVAAVSTAQDFSVVKCFDADKFPLLAKHVDHVYLKDTAPETGLLWWPAHLQSGPVEDPRARLIEIVHDKNESAQTYDWQNASERWLLICSASEGLSDMVGIYSDPEIQESIGELHFSRVYVWNKFFETIDEIYPSFINVFDAQKMVLHRRNYPPAVKSFVVETMEIDKK